MEEEKQNFGKLRIILKGAKIYVERVKFEEE